MQPLVSIVILNYNGKELSKCLIESIKRIDFPKEKLEIIVVDNASRDGSQEFIRKNYPEIKLIENKKNLGFDEGTNVGVRYCNGKYIAILSNDILVDENWLKELVRAIESDEKIGIVEPWVYNKTPEGKYIIDDYGTTSIFHTHIFRKDVKIDTSEYVRVFTATSACLFRRDIVELPFDKDYFAYAEDTYFGWLVRLKGYEIIHVPSSKIYHEGSETIKKLNKNNYFDFLAERNKIMNLLIFYEGKTLLKLLPLLLLFTILINLFNIRLLLTRFKVYFWLIKNIRLVRKKRADIQKQRKVPDKDILKLMSCKFIEERRINNRIAKFFVQVLNGFSCVYCRIINLGVVGDKKKT
ncbi:MAG: glycosyltransferase family 2 protein [Nanoarchaeota archaeon]